jgi:(1->4)-alpha-D-glucan 1-alpha-D-glucosylmutase
MWELSLVDPDNRRPLDRAALRAAFADVKRRFSEANVAAGSLAELLDSWPDGRVKLHLIWRVLGLRRKLPELFAQGTYRPLRATGARASHVIAFVRSNDTARAITIAPRFWPALMKPANGPADWRGTAVKLPAGRYENWLVGTTVEIAARQPVAMTDLLQDFPVALLVQTAA